MTQPMQHTAANGAAMGLKARIAGLLKERLETSSVGLSIGEIGSALSLPKTDHGSLAAALVKLRSEGKVKTVSGPATSSLGPRFVKRYAWKLKPESSPAPVSPEQINDRRFLSLCK